MCCRERGSVLAAESKEEYFGGSQNNTHFFEGMLQCSTKSVNLVLKALFSSLFFSRSFFPMVQAGKTLATLQMEFTFQGF